MNLPRFKVRRLMAVIALAGAALGSWSWMARRSAALQAQAAAHAERAARASLACRIDQRRVDYHEGLARKYERAARSPWLPVEADPPEP